MNIFITGGTGFIGKHLVKYLLTDCSNKITLLVRRSSNVSSFQKEISSGQVKLVYGELETINTIEGQLKETNIIYHLAANVDVGKSNVKQLYRDNVEGTRNIIEFAKLNCKQLVAFFFLSSIGAIRRSSDNYEIANEQTMYKWKMKDKKHYSYTKYLSENMVIEESKNGFPGFVGNPSIVLGEGSKNRALIFAFKLGLFKFMIKPGGYFNLVHVKDVVNGIQLIIKKGNPGERYLLVGDNVSFKDFFKYVACLAQKKQWQIFLPLWIVCLFFPLRGLFKYSCYSNDKAKTILGWEPEFSWQEAVKETFIFLKRENLL